MSAMRRNSRVPQSSSERTLFVVNENVCQMFTFFPRILVSWETQTCSHWSTAVVSVRGSGQNWCRGKNVVMFMVPILILLTREILSHHPLLPPPYFFLYWKMSGRFFFGVKFKLFQMISEFRHYCLFKNDVVSDAAHIFSTTIILRCVFMLHTLMYFENSFHSLWIFIDLFFFELPDISLTNFMV